MHAQKVDGKGYLNAVEVCLSSPLFLWYKLH